MQKKKKSMQLGTMKIAFCLFLIIEKYGPVDTDVKRDASQSVTAPNTRRKVPGEG